MSWKAALSLAATVLVFVLLFSETDASCYRQYRYKKITRHLPHYLNTVRQYPYGKSRVLHLRCTAYVSLFVCGGHCSQRHNYYQKGKASQCCVATRTTNSSVWANFRCTSPGYYYKVIHKKVKLHVPFPVRCRCRRARKCDA